MNRHSKMKLTRFAKKQRILRQDGWDAFHLGKPITSFPGGGETARAAWEIGWRAAKEGSPKPYTT